MQIISNASSVLRTPYFHCLANGRHLELQIELTIKNIWSSSELECIY
jgi:hypothetical protein